MRGFASTTYDTKKSGGHGPARAEGLKAFAPAFGAGPLNTVIHRKASCACGGGCPACQSKSSDLKVSNPDDAAEIEADRVADQVMRMMDTSAHRPAGRISGHEPNVQRKPVAPGTSRMVQRQASELEEEEIPDDGIDIQRFENGNAGRGLTQRAADPEEDAADAAADAAMAGPEIEGGGEDEEDVGGEETIQAKRESDAVTIESPGAAGRLRGDIDQARGGGTPLAEPVRSRMEAAFGADLGGVRVHTGGRAAELASSLGALAFTTGRDIFFGDGRYDPGSADGRRLLAHELTHVIQQGVTPGSGKTGISRAGNGSVQLPPGPAKKPLIGTIYYYDSGGNLFDQKPVYELNEFLPPPGEYFITLALKSDGNYVLRVAGRDQNYVLIPSDPIGMQKLLAKADGIALRIYGKGSGKSTGEPTRPPSAGDPKGQADPNSKTLDPQTTPPAGAPASEAREGDRKAGDQPSEGNKKEAPDAGKGGGEGKSDTPAPGSATDKNGGDALPGEEKSGGKYGVFGMIDLPKPLADFLEGAIDLLGDAEEMEALRDTLLALKGLIDNREALAELFANPESLLEIALGLKPNKAMDVIESWVSRDVDKPKPSKNTNRKGIAALAVRVVAIVGKIRKVIQPIFAIRKTVRSAIGGVGLLMEEIPVLESLLDPNVKLTGVALQSALDEFAVDFVDHLKEKLDSAPKMLKAGFEKFTEAQLITYEEVARAITAAILGSVPKQYQWAVKIGKKVGLDDVIADKGVAKLIPASALNEINDVFRSLIKLLEPTIDGAADLLQMVIDELTPRFLEDLPDQIRSVIKPSLKSGRAMGRVSPKAIAGMIGRSAGNPMEESIQTEAETRMGQFFDGVRLHTDPAAAEASERLNANAFAIGGDVFFGPGKYQPDTAEGRRLLYHELAHTGQQSNVEPTVRPDAKDMAKRMAKYFSPAIMAELKGAWSKKKSDNIARINTSIIKAERLVTRKTKVVSRNNPALPFGYMYIPKEKGPIKYIRRTIEWVRLLPPLSIGSGGVIEWGIGKSAEDRMKDSARRTLRRVLGCEKGKQEAHHLIPLEFFSNHRVVKVAVENGFLFNGDKNGACISKNYHSGSHSIYNDNVRVRLDNLEKTYGTNWANIEKPLFALLDKLKAEVMARRSKLV
jgi:hypothetical protein